MYTTSYPPPSILVPLVDVHRGLAALDPGPADALQHQDRGHLPEERYQGDVAHLLLEKLPVQRQPLRRIDSDRELVEQVVDLRIDVATAIVARPAVLRRGDALRPQAAVVEVVSGRADQRRPGLGRERLASRESRRQLLD